ncbi:ribosomal protein S18-alanine N-acetyltransferase [Gemmiger sp. An120]|uniref:ribosomal protein S18-alanine N-acetyltransferase n=1 Tax=Gemmiger sp. An120 TaxID=1965549 RepID=UPI0019D12D06|nr:ribosomal protein S18-alanine N-acetyltransferase [Gemmiger sp. An120]
MAGWTIRAMEPGDLPRCAAIEATAPDPWTEPQLAEELASDFGRLFVACRDGQTAGLAVFQLAAGEASLNALTVDPAARRQGAGRALLTGALAALRAEGAQSCFLEVRAGNAAARALYESVGFAAAGVRRGFYRNPAEDAVVMALNLD